MRVADERRGRTEGYITIQSGKDLGLRCGATQLTHLISLFASWSWIALAHNRVVPTPPVCQSARSIPSHLVSSHLISHCSVQPYPVSVGGSHAEGQRAHSDIATPQPPCMDEKGGGRGAGRLWPLARQRQYWCSETANERGAVAGYVWEGRCSAGDGMGAGRRQ